MQRLQLPVLKVVEHLLLEEGHRRVDFELTNYLLQCRLKQHKLSLLDEQHVVFDLYCLRYRLKVYRVPLARGKFFASLTVNSHRVPLFQRLLPGQLIDVAARRVVVYLVKKKE